MNTQDSFSKNLKHYFDEMNERVSNQNGEWTVKGFIDIYQRIYTISIDTKVLSKVLELLMFPILVKFAQDNNYRIALAKQQNHYPDISFINNNNQYYALDIKTTYRTGKDRNGQVKVNGMTLGTFGGYFRARETSTNITFPYNRYLKHYVLGVIYTPTQNIDERKVYTISDLNQIPSVATDFSFFLHEKYQIASDRAGSGNTRNIGSTVYLERLLNGTGVFSQLGVDVFDDYWMNYRTQGMAREDGFSTPPYRNLIEYKRFKESGTSILQVPEDQIQTETNDVDETTD